MIQQLFDNNIFYTKFSHEFAVFITFPEHSNFSSLNFEKQAKNWPFVNVVVTNIFLFRAIIWEDETKLEQLSWLETFQLENLQRMLFVLTLRSR